MGTAVAATTVWRGQGTIEDARKVTFPKEDIGILGGTDRAYIGEFLAKLSMGAVPATYQQLPYLFNAAIKSLTTGAADGPGTDKVYAFPIPTTAQPTIKTFTLEGGDDNQAEKMEYSFVDQFKLSGKAKEALMMSADWQGRQVQNATFTAALAIPSVEDVLFQKGSLYLDAIGGTFGTTQKSNTLIGFDLTYKSGIVPVWTGDGNQYFSFIKVTEPSCEGEITFEHEATAVAEKTLWRAGTSRMMRLKFTGSNVATPGTTYTTQTFNIDLIIKWESWSKLDEQNGNDIVKAKFKARYNATAAAMGTFTVVNELSPLT